MNHENFTADLRASGDFELPAGVGAPGDAVPPIADEPEPAQSGSPRVVIEYRARGLPWVLVLPLAGLVSLGAIATYHQLTGLGGATVQPPPTSPMEVGATAPDRRASAVLEPLALSSRRVAASAAPPQAAATVEVVDPARIAERNLDEVLRNIPFPPPLLNQIPRPQIPGFSDSTLQAALAFSSPLPNIPKRSEETVPAQAVVNQPAPAPPTPPPADPTARGREADAPRSPDAAPTPPPADLATLPPFTEAPSDPPAEQAAPPLPTALPSREEVLAEIQREADAKQEERRELSRFKDQAPEAARREYAARIQDERASFHAELRNLIRQRNAQTGLAIGQLHNRYSENVDPQLESKFRLLLKRFSGRTSIRSKILALRALGLPEPRILEIVVSEVHRREHSSRCRMFEPEMYVLAARELLAAELPTSTRRRATDSRDDPADGPTRPASVRAR